MDTTAGSWAATTVCVNNSADLDTALFVNAGNHANVTIQIARGTYDLGASMLAGGGTDHQAGLNSGTRLLGGYSADCSSRDIALGNTVITNSGTDLGIDLVGDITIEGLTFSAHNGLTFYACYDDFHDDPPLPAGTEVLLRRDAFLGANNSGVRVMWCQDESVGGTVRIVDSVVAHNSSTLGCSVELEVLRGTPVLSLVNDTIVDNANGGGCLNNVNDTIAGEEGHGSLEAFNSIFYGNSYSDLDSYPGPFLVDNVIGQRTGSTPLLETGTLSGDPQLSANYRPIESPPSPVINSGDNDPAGGLPAHDLDGGPRVIGTTVDRGAYESAIDNELIQTVSNNNDSGAGSLRAAINSANATGAALITFDLGSGCGPHVITLNSALPALTAGAVINGYTQSGATANDLYVGDDATLCVILEAASSSVATGIQVASNAGDSAAVSIKGLAFSGFATAAIDLQGGSGHFVSGNHFGGSVGGHALQPNGVDIRLGTAAHDALIGSDDVADRNIIGDATGSGIVLQGGASGSLVIGTNNNQILNNYIGVGWSVGGGNYTNRANGTRGIHLLGHDNTISGNVIGDNLQAGILVDGGGAVNNTIARNFIGADASNVVLGNGNAGIHLLGNIGDAPHDNTIRYNTLADNGGEGIWIGIGQHNKIRANSIFANGGLGIALAGESVLANDDDGGIQQTDYANRGQNYPVLSGAAGGYHTGRVSGSLTTTGGDYTVDIYTSPGCDASGHGEGRTWLRSGSVTVMVPAGLDQAMATFDIAFKTTASIPLPNGVAITATATDAAGDTSEFSACRSYLNDTIFADGFEQPPA